MNKVILLLLSLLLSIIIVIIIVYCSELWLFSFDVLFCERQKYRNKWRSLGRIVLFCFVLLLLLLLLFFCKSDSIILD